jgi:hypothetical protein
LRQSLFQAIGQLAFYQAPHVRRAGNWQGITFAIPTPNKLFEGGIAYIGMCEKMPGKDREKERGCVPMCVSQHSK